MKKIQEILKKEGYKKLNFKVSKTQHLLIKATINGVKGNFILDTGASNTCVGIENTSFFQLTAGSSSTTAAGAGATGMLTQIANNNILQIGRWKRKSFAIVIFDLSHVNEALIQHKTKPVHGIIGADVFLKAKGIIDYNNHCLYLM